MNTILIFTDAATSPQTGLAIGAFLCVNKQDLDEYSADLNTKVANKITYIEYQSKKSTWSEIKTVIHALEVVLKNSGAGHNIEIYTDCQSLCDLLGKRKEKLVKSNFITRTGKILNNADLYKELYAITEKFTIQAYKIKGHASKSHRLTMQEQIFDVLDKLSRKKLRIRAVTVRERVQKK